ncbi:MAG: hypothetical protein ACLTAF_02535 [Blautia coccoides]
MIITWKNGTFNTQPLTIKIRLHWDNRRMATILPLTAKAAPMDTIMGKYNSILKNQKIR